MAQFQNPFDATQVAPREPMDVLPDNDYPVMIEASEWKPTRKGDGQFLELTLQVVDGQYKGRKLWDRLNLANPSAAAMEIAQQTLSAICHATGVMTVADSSQLHNIPMLAKVKVKPGENGPMNEVKGYKKLSGVTAPSPVMGNVFSVGSTAPAAPAAPPVAPWIKKAS